MIDESGPEVRSNNVIPFPRDRLTDATRPKKFVVHDEITGRNNVVELPLRPRVGGLSLEVPKGLVADTTDIFIISNRSGGRGFNLVFSDPDDPDSALSSELMGKKLKEGGSINVNFGEGKPRIGDVVVVTYVGQYAGATDSIGCEQTMYVYDEKKGWVNLGAGDVISLADSDSDVDEA